MNQFVGNFEKVIKGMDIQVPAQITEMIQANLDQAISVYEKAAQNMKSYGEAANAALGKQQALTRGIGERVLHNANAHIDVSLDVAKKIAGSRPVHEALKIQTDFVQAQTKRLAEHANDMMSLAMKSHTESDVVREAVTKDFEALRKEVLRLIALEPSLRAAAE